MAQLHIPPALVSWWTRSGGVFPWIEDNQGFISLLALVAALGVALIEQRRALAEQKRALVEEARALRRAEDARAEAEAEARRAEIDLRLRLVGEFAVAVRGLLLDVGRALQDDLRTTTGFMIDGVTFSVPDAVVMRGAQASAETIHALLAGPHLSPALIRASRQAMAALLLVSEGANAVGDHDFREVYTSWQVALDQARSDVTQGELELVYLLRPPPPQAEFSLDIESKGHL